MSLPVKSFVTEEEAEQRRKERQLEWERVRKPSDPVEVPEEPYDSRSLYDRLQEQRDKDQKDFEDKYAFKNSFRGIDEEEAQFLDHVSDVQVQMLKEKEKEEETELEEYRRALEEKLQPKEPTIAVLPAKKLIPKTAKSSQASLLASVVKRKSSGSTSEDKPASSSEDPPAKQQKLSSEVPSKNANSKSSDYVTVGPAAYCAGVLPGIGPYSDSSDTDSSDTDELTASSLTVISRRVRNGKPSEGSKH